MMQVIYGLVVMRWLLACKPGSSQAETPGDLSVKAAGTPSDAGCFNDTFPILAAICPDEKIAISHESWGCFHHYEDVFEISGDAPLVLEVYRRHPSGDTSKLDLVEEKGTVALKAADIDEADRFIAHSLAIDSQEESSTPSVMSTTEDTLRLIWYRDGEIVDEVSVKEYGGIFPFLSGMLSRSA